MQSWIEHEMTEGYLDGLNPDSPEPSGNRSYCYINSFSIGRFELCHGQPPDTAANLRIRAKKAEALDMRLVT